MTTLLNNLARTGRLALLALAFTPTSAWAEAQLRSELETAAYTAGESFAWTLTVQGAKRAEAPEIPSSADFSVHADAPQILEKDGERTFVFRYRLIPRRPGNLQLPTISVVADEEELAPEAASVNVGEPEASSEQRLEVSFAHHEVYVGQPVELIFTWFSALPLESVKAVDIQLPMLYNPEFEVIVPTAERKAAPNPNLIGLPVEGQRVLGTLGSVDVNGRRFSTVTFRRTFVPRQPGNFTVPAARLFCSARPAASPLLSGPRARSFPNGQIYPAFFDNEFFQDAKGEEGYSHFNAKADDLTLSVRPLPDKGRPPHFSGIVGTGKLLAQADPTNLKIGDPVTITISLKDFPLPEALSLPALGELADLSGQFQIPEEESSPRIQGNDAVFVQSVRPLRTSITQIPAFSLVVFNPESGEYETLTSAAMPLRVSPDGEITSINAELEAAPALTYNPAGIWHNMGADEVDLLTRVGRILEQTALAWLLLPVAAFIAGAGPAKRFRLKRSDPEEWRRQTAFAFLKGALRKAKNPQGQRMAVSGYLSVRLGICEGALSYQEIIRALQAHRVSLEEETRAVLLELFHQADLAQFLRQSPAASLPAKRILQAVELLERRLQ